MNSGNGKNVLYYNCKVDLQSVAEIRTLIGQIDDIISELLTSAFKAVSTGNIAEYELDTGQNRSRVRYTSVSSVSSSIKEFRDLRQMLVNDIENKVAGRVTQLVDQSNFRTR